MARTSYGGEIEEILYEHVAVREAAVVGIAHRELGEEVTAAVALKASVALSEAEIPDYVRLWVASTCARSHGWFVDGLPKGPMERVLWSVLELFRQLALATVETGP